MDISMVTRRRDGRFRVSTRSRGQKSRDAECPRPLSFIYKLACHPCAYFAVTTTFTGDELVASWVESPRYFAVTA